MECCFDFRFAGGDFVLKFDILFRNWILFLSRNEFQNKIRFLKTLSWFGYFRKFVRKDIPEVTTVSKIVSNCFSTRSAKEKKRYSILVKHVPLPGKNCENIVL